jgi:hypothetical protein
MKFNEAEMKLFPYIFDAGILSHAMDALSAIFSMELMLFVVAMISYRVMVRIRLQARCRMHPHKISECADTFLADSCQESESGSDSCQESESCERLVEPPPAEEDCDLHPQVSNAAAYQYDSQPRKPRIQILSPLDIVIQRGKDKPDVCSNVIAVSGHRSKVKAASRTLRKHGFLKSCSGASSPLDGHWQTDHGLNVIIEGKLVRWTYQRASRLEFVKVDKSSCQLMLYGELVQGHVVQSSIPGVAKTLQWGNGDVWHSYHGRCIDKEEVFLQTMSKIRHDDAQDELVRARALGRLKAVSKDGFVLLPHCIDHVLRYIGSDTYYFNVCFDTHGGRPWAGSGNKDFLSTVSRRHPRVEIHHCWFAGSNESCGQRKIAEGCDIDLS